MDLFSDDYLKSNDVKKVYHSSPPITGEETGVELRDIGIEQAMMNADRQHEKWTVSAYNFLLSYIQTNKEFMAEDVRAASFGIVIEPPHNRAWGGIFVKAVKSGLIKRKGFRNVTNAKAHCTPATLWGVV